MATLTLQTVNVALKGPLGGAITGARILFQLPSFDVEGESVVLPVAQEIALDAEGEGSAPIYSTVAGENGFAYKVTAVFSDANTGRLVEVFLGHAAVPVSGGPFDLTDLLTDTAPDPTPSDLLAAINAAVTSTTANAATATAAAATATTKAGEAVAAAASTGLPSLTGHGGKFIQIKADASGYEVRTAAEMRANIGAMAFGGNYSGNLNNLGPVTPVTVPTLFVLASGFSNGPANAAVGDIVIVSPRLANWSQRVLRSNGATLSDAFRGTASGSWSALHEDLLSRGYGGIPPTSDRIGSTNRDGPSYWPAGSGTNPLPGEDFVAYRYLGNGTAGEGYVVAVGQTSGRFFYAMRPAAGGWGAWIELARTGGAYVSADTTITANSITNFAHGLGAAPANVAVHLVCATAELGYSVGDIAPMQNYDTQASQNGWWADATNVGVSVRASLAVMRKDTGAMANITLASWRLRVRGWR